MPRKYKRKRSYRPYKPVQVQTDGTSAEVNAHSALGEKLQRHCMHMKHVLESTKMLPASATKASQTAAAATMGGEQTWECSMRVSVSGKRLAATGWGPRKQKSRHNCAAALLQLAKGHVPTHGNARAASAPRLGAAPTLVKLGTSESAHQGAVALRSVQSPAPQQLQLQLPLETVAAPAPASAAGEDIEGCTQSRQMDAAHTCTPSNSVRHPISHQQPSKAPLETAPRRVLWDMCRDAGVDLSSHFQVHMYFYAHSKQYKAHVLFTHPWTRQHWSAVAERPCRFSAYRRAVRKLVQNVTATADMHATGQAN